MSRKIRRTETFDIVNNAMLALVLLIVLYPLLYVLSASFSHPNYIYTGEMWLLPKGITLDGYRRILQYKDLWVGYYNTLIYTVGGTVLNLVVTLPCAYALSRRDFRARHVFMTMFLVTMYIGGGLIPSYLNLVQLRLINTRALMLITGLTSAYNIIISRTFFQSAIPLEVQEAATIDGCSNMGIFVRIVLPLSKAIIAVMALYFAIGHWNDYFNAMIALRNRALFPLQLILREILVQSQISAELLANAEADTVKALLEKQMIANQLKYGVIVVSALPLLIVYPFLQRYFVQGVLIGSVKG